MDRRSLFRSAAVAAAGMGLTAASLPATAQEEATSLAGLTPPGQRRGGFLQINGARIFYQLAGQGQPMLLIHGYPLSGALFIRVRQRLAQRYRVITPDLRGYGNSTAPSLPDTIQGYATDMLGLMNTLGIERAYIGGMSMGGPIVLEMYRQAPQRFSGMILIDTIAAMASPAEAGMWRGVAAMAYRGGVAAVIPQVDHFFLTGAARLVRPEEDAYLRLVQGQASKQGAIGGAIALARRPDYTGLLGNIGVPTRVLVGAEDDVYPIEIARQVAGAIRGARLTIIPRAAHAAIFEAPELAAAAILG